METLKNTKECGTGTQDENLGVQSKNTMVNVVSGGQ